MRKIKEILFSENGMKAVNTLFLLAMFFYSSGLLFVAYIVWICYLVFCIRNTESRGSKVVYSVFVGLAVVMIGVRLYGLIQGMITGEFWCSIWREGRKSVQRTSCPS